MYYALAIGQLGDWAIGQVIISAIIHGFPIVNHHGFASHQNFIQMGSGHTYLFKKVWGLRGRTTNKAEKNQSLHEKRKEREEASLIQS